MQKIHFHFYDRTATLKDRTILKQFIKGLFIKEKVILKSLSYVFCSDEYLLKINNDFLKHDFYTDVITFNLSSSEKEVEAEVYLSVDRIKDNARQMGISFNEELHRVLFHGALHLCGFKDKKKSDLITMRLKEDEYLQLYFK